MKQTSNCFFLFLIISLTNCNHRLSKGQYRGIEAITVASNKTYWPGVLNFGVVKDSTNEKWFHEVTISIKKSSATILKRPFKIKDGIISFSDSTGGFYSYNGNVHYDHNDKTFTISGSLDNCKFCPVFATATPLYVYESFIIQKKMGYWIVQTNYEKNIIFKRQ